MDIYRQVATFYESFIFEKRVIGKTLFGHSMYAMKVGNGYPCGIVQCGIHGREYITARLALRQLEIGVARGSCWFIPLVNPDGALLSQKGVSSAPLEWQSQLLVINGGRNFLLWKANGRGVDLNVNFAAKWGEGVKNVRYAGAENYIGAYPFSEPETMALKAFTEEIAPQYTVSYHTKGEEIYWYFHQSPRTCLRDRRLAELLSRTTGYPMKTSVGSVGGYKDWCIETLKIPSFTVEVGKDTYTHPLGEDALEDILLKNECSI